MIFACSPQSSLVRDVSATPVAFSNALTRNYYVLVASVACWVHARGHRRRACQPGDGSCYLPADTPLVLDAALGSDLSIVADAAEGRASLSTSLF